MKTTLLVLISFLLIKADRNINSQVFTHKKKAEATSSKVVTASYTYYNLSFVLDLPSHTLYVHWDPTDIGSVLNVPVQWVEDHGQVRYVTMQDGWHTEIYGPAALQPNVTQHYYIGNNLATFKWDGVHPQCIVICQPSPNGGCSF